MARGFITRTCTSECYLRRFSQSLGFCSDDRSTYLSFCSRACAVGMQPVFYGEDLYRDGPKDEPNDSRDFN